MNTPAQIWKPLEQLIDLRKQSAQQLERVIDDLGGTAVDEGVGIVGAESPTEGVARQLEQAIAVSLEAIGEVTPETRLPVHRAIVEDAAALAAIRSVLGEEIAPDAFVLGSS